MGLRDVAVGFFSFTEITDPAQHRQYNEWHQLDHLPEQYSIEGIIHGERWVASPRCREARLLANNALDAADYMTLYLLAEPIAVVLKEFMELAATLHAQNRFFDARRAVLSGPFAHLGTDASPSIGVGASVLAFRPSTGVYVLVEEGHETTTPTGALLATPGVAGVSRFTARDPKEGRWEPGSHAVTLCYLDADPVGVAGALEPLLAPWCASSPARFAGPYEAVRPFDWDWFETG